MEDRVSADPDQPRQPKKTPSTAVALAVLALIVAVGVLLAVSGNEDPPAANEAVFDPLIAADVAEDWWRNVIARKDSAAARISHPDSSFDFQPLGDLLPDGTSTVAVVIDSVPFGTTDAPQLCYILLTSEDQFTGSVVFRINDGVWLPLEVRPDSDNCYVPPRPSS